MARKLTDEDILRISRARVTESAASTFTQVEIDTQLSVERGVIWMLEFVEFIFGPMGVLNEVAVNGAERISLQLAKTTQTAILNGNDPDLIQIAIRELNRSAAIGTDAGPLWYLADRVVKYTFSTPFPVASQGLFFGIEGTDASAVNSADIRIGYVIREVSDKFFFRVAQALVG